MNYTPTSTFILYFFVLIAHLSSNPQLWIPLASLLSASSRMLLSTAEEITLLILLMQQINGFSLSCVTPGKLVFFL